MRWDSMQNFVGMMEYLMTWTWTDEATTVRTSGGLLFRIDALPILVDDRGELASLAINYVSGKSVFASDRQAFAYMMALARRDLQYRGMRDERVNCFQSKQDANFLLYRLVRDCDNAEEYECMRQRWDTLNRPKYRDLQWSPEQAKAIAVVKQGCSYEDEELRCLSRRFLYVMGPPGSGKSAVLLELAIWACQTMMVLIICPTGFLVHQYKSKLPDRDGIENIRVDTLQGVLNYKRTGSDSKVTWAPPSALRRIDLILLDEGSQYEDREWSRFYSSVKEQPHLPYVVTVADFQQLQPVVSGGLCQRFCEKMETVELKTVYRSTDEAHLVFLNRIRVQQLDRSTLSEYFDDRHWRHQSMSSCVAAGIKLAEDAGEPFTWLTCNNAGASEVCEAALSLLGLSAELLKTGYYCDPNTKSELRIVAKPGIVIRLSRNFDKSRGFVNGALAVVCDSLQGNAVFTARLVGTGNMVLVHPMEEDGSRFLPCCYGYATTIRRAQGADLFHGCIYFDQKKRAAARGYGYSTFQNNRYA